MIPGFIGADPLVFKRDGPNMTLVEHFLRKGVVTPEAAKILPKLCSSAKLDVDLYMEKRIGVSSFLRLAQA